MQLLLSGALGPFLLRPARLGVMVGSWLMLAACTLSGPRPGPPPEPGTLLWTFEDSGEGASVGSDGRVVVGDDYGHVYALDPEGKRQWAYLAMAQAGADIPTIAPDGTVYVGSHDHHVYALKSGAKRWAFEADDWVPGSPSLGEDGTVYFGDAGGAFYALSPQGVEKWAFDARGDWIGASASIGGDGTLYVGDGAGRRGHLYALTPAGEVRWVFETADWVKYGPAIAADGTLYLVSGNRLHAVRDGEEKWVFEAEEDVDVQPVLGPKGTVYFGSRDGRFYALTPGGSRKWAFPVAEAAGFHRNGSEESAPPPKWDQVLTAAAVGEDGTVYVASRHGLLIALSPAGDVRWTRKMAGDFMGPGDIRLGPDGTLYVANDEGLRAIATAANGPADSAWPQYLGDPRGTGRQP